MWLLTIWLKGTMIRTEMTDSKIKKWKTLKAELAFDQKWMPIWREMVELPDGTVIDDFYLWEEGDIVMVVPVLANGSLVMVRQYRHGSEKISLEFPAGWVDKDESLDQAIKRELLEETGYAAHELKLLTQVHPAPGKMRGTTHIFLAKVSQDKVDQNLERTENIQVVTLDQEHVEDKIMNGEISDTRTISAMYFYERSSTSGQQVNLPDKLI